jgi:hypothetical protein
MFCEEKVNAIYRIQYRNPFNFMQDSTAPYLRVDHHAFKVCILDQQAGRGRM